MTRGFRRVPPAPPMQRDEASGITTFGGGMQTGGQVVDLGGGKFGVSAAAGEHGVPSSNYYDDPLVNELATLPSLEEAMAYKGSRPSFKGVQRPGDYQRVVQREMADKASGGRLPQMLEDRQTAAKARRGDFTPNEADVAEAMGSGASAFTGRPDVETLAAKLRQRYGT